MKTVPEQGHIPSWRKLFFWELPIWKSIILLKFASRGASAACFAPFGDFRPTLFLKGTARLKPS
jgi:hypothetical protein